MNARKFIRPTLVDLARDPMVRLMMASDGVTEAELVGVLTRAQRAVARHAGARLVPTRAKPRSARAPVRYRCNVRRAVR
jgi:hypothetical protein